MSSAAKALDGTARFSRSQLDPLLSPVLAAELPGLANALDEDAARPLLQAALFGDGARRQIVRCRPVGAMYLGGDSCVLRYELEVRDTASGEAIEPLVLGRVFRDHTACAAFLRDRLEPAATRLDGHPQLALFRTPVALIEPLGMAVHAFPIHPELPALGDATDRGRLIDLVAERVPDIREGRFTIRDVRVEVAHIGRFPRCTLRYTFEGTATGRAPHRLVLYGKVAGDRAGDVTTSVVAALRERLGGGNRVNIPRVLGFWPDWRLLLLEAIPGRPFIKPLLRAHLAGSETPHAGAPALEAAIAACGRVAAAIHTTKIGLGGRGGLDDELACSGRSIQALRRISPDLGAELHAWHGRIAACARRAPPLPLSFSHGDFTETNIISDGLAHGLVDFDSVCQAEPALDLGQFLARQRLAVVKYQRPDAPLPAAETERLCALLLEAYVDAAGCDAAAAERLRARVPVYETLMLLRLALHSWQKFKVGRLANVVTLLAERIACLA